MTANPEDLKDLEEAAGAKVPTTQFIEARRDGVVAEASTVPRNSTVVARSLRLPWEKEDTMDDGNIAVFDPDLAVCGSSDDGETPLAIFRLLARRYDRKVLFDLVWQLPLQKLASMFGKADTEIGGLCRKLHIPLPGVGYWSRLNAGLPVDPRPLLPAEV